MKFSLDEVVEAMKGAKVNPDVIDNTLQELAKLEDELKKAKDPSSRVKKKFVILASSSPVLDNEGVDITEIPMWIVQIEEDEDHTQIIDKIQRATKLYKDTPKRKEVQIETLGEAIREVPKKNFSAFGVNLKTKEPVLVVETSNVLTLGRS